MRRALYLLAAAACLALTAPTRSQSSIGIAVVPATGSAVLRGLPGALVVVELIDADAMRDGLTRDSIQVDIEQILRKAGIRVLTESECMQTPGRPYLYVRVGALRGPDGLYSYDVDLTLNEEVFLARDTTVRVTGATTWNAAGTLGLTGSVNLPQVRMQVHEMAEKFCADYAAANSGRAPLVPADRPRRP